MRVPGEKSRHAPRNFGQLGGVKLMRSQTLPVVIKQTPFNYFSVTSNARNFPQLPHLLLTGIFAVSLKIKKRLCRVRRLHFKVFFIDFLLFSSFSWLRPLFSGSSLPPKMKSRVYHCVTDMVAYGRGRTNTNYCWSCSPQPCTSNA